MATRRFIQCDVFTATPTLGNGLAVVLDGEGLSEAAMQGFAAWTNLAETTFLLPPATPGADYRVRIFTPDREMPFAGHPTLGSCMSWLHAGGTPATPGLVRQECAVGLVEIDVSGKAPAFVAPPIAVAPLPAGRQEQLQAALGLAPEAVSRSTALNNGPDWEVLELASAEAVLAVEPQGLDFPVHLGIFGPHAPGGDCDFEVRMFSYAKGLVEDPITGSLNAALARWMYEAGHWQGDKRVAQGTRLGREGRVEIRRRDDKVWIGGEVQILIEGSLTL